MTKEEKARAYDEALKDMRVIYPTLSGDAKLAVEHAFPQLAESDDERIRKEIIRIVDIWTNSSPVVNGIPREILLAWLEKQKDLDKMIVVSPEVWDKAISDAFENGKKDGEKQKEQKPDMLQNAFDKSKKDYTLEEKSKASDYAESILPTSIIYGESEEEYKLHTIIEAAFIAGQKEQKSEWSDEDRQCFDEAIEALESLGFDGEASNLKSLRDYRKPLNTCKPTDWSYDNRIQYASVKSGIEAFASTYSFNIESKLFPQLTKEQQQLWREEIEQAVIAGGENGIELARDNRYKENKTEEWNKEDEAMLNSITWGIHMKSITPLDEMDDRNKYEKYEDFLKSLPERFNLQPKQEWSEEDEEIREEVIGDLCALKDWIIKYDTNWLVNPVLKNIDKRISWLKSLRPSWKPSEEQMKAIKHAYNSFPNDCSTKLNLRLLYHDLQKLI